MCKDVLFITCPNRNKCVLFYYIDTTTNLYFKAVGTCLELGGSTKFCLYHTHILKGYGFVH